MPLSMLDPLPESERADRKKNGPMPSPFFKELSLPMELKPPGLDIVANALACPAVETIMRLRR